MKKILDRLKLAENIIEKNFSKDDKNYGLLVCGCFCLLGKFGDEFLSLVENVFNNTTIIIEEGNIIKLAEEHGLDQFSFSDIPEEETKFIDGLSYSGIHYYFKPDGKVIDDFTNPIVIIPNNNNKNNNQLLNTFIHEISHLIKSQVDASYNQEYNYYSIRCGISLYEVNFNNRNMIDNCTFNALDEIINVFQTTDMMLDLELLKDIKCDNKIRNFLNTINFMELDDFLGYEGLIEPFVDLWINDEFRNIIEYDIVVGNLDNIVNNFNNIMGRNCFLYFSMLCDDLENSEDNNKCIELENMIYQIIEEFNLKTTYQYKK